MALLDLAFCSGLSISIMGPFLATVVNQKYSVSALLFRSMFHLHPSFQVSLSSFLPLSLITSNASFRTSKSRLHSLRCIIRYRITHHLPKNSKPASHPQPVSALQPHFHTSGSNELLSPYEKTIRKCVRQAISQIYISLRVHAGPP